MNLINLRYFLTLLLLCKISCNSDFEQNYNHDDEAHADLHETDRHGRNSNHNFYQQQQQTQYLYTIETSTGLTGWDPQHSSFRLQSKIQLVRADATTWLVKLGDLTFSQANGPLMEPLKIARPDLFQKLTTTPKLSKLLQLPMKFSQNNGKIGEIIFDGEDEPWSMNIKRGLINMFQVNFNQKRDAFSTRNPNQGDDGSDKFYSLFEDTVEGKCLTSYSLKAVPMTDAGTHKAYNVTKSVDFETCVERPLVAYNMQSLEVCPSANSHSEDLLKSSSITSYTLIGSPARFLIVSAHTTSQYTFDASGPQSTPITTTVNQQIKLVQSNGGSTVNEPNNPKKSENGMVYSVEWDSAYEKSFMFGRSSQLKKLISSQYATSTSILALAEKAFNKLRSPHGEKTTAASTEAFLRLVELMRMCTAEDLEHLEHSAAGSSGGKTGSRMPDSSRDFYAQMLGLCGSKVCVQKLTALIRRNKVPVVVAILALKQVANTPIPSEDIVQEILDLTLQSDKKQESSNYVLRQTLWFLSGTLINGLCGSDLERLAINQPRDTITCQPQFKQRFVQVAMRQLRASRDWENSLIYTKALGNAGLLGSIPDLENLINQKHGLDESVRSSAIYALRKMLKTKPSKVNSILMPIASDSKEPSQIRISAVDVMLSRQADGPTLNQLASIARFDTDIQLKAFIHSALHALAKSKSICETRKAHMARLASQKSEGTASSAPTSHLGVSSWNDHKSGRGFDFEWSTSFTNHSNGDTPQPFHRVLNIHTNWMDLTQKYAVGVGMVNIGGKNALKKAFNSLLGMDAHQEKNGEPPHGARNEPWREISDGDEEEASEERDTWFGSEQSEQNDLTDRSKSVLYLQLKDQNVALLPFSDSMVQSMKPFVKKWEQDLRKGARLDSTTPMLWRDITYKIPSSCGLPISATIKVPIILNIKGAIKTAKSLRTTSSFSVEAALFSSVIGTSITNVELWSPVAYHGAKIESKVQLNVDINVKIETNLNQKVKTIKLTAKVPRQTLNLAEISTKRVTYSAHRRDHVEGSENANERPISRVHHGIGKNSKKCYKEMLTGANICVTNSGAGCFLCHQPSSSNATIKFEPKEQTGQEIVVKVTIQPQSNVNGENARHHSMVTDQIKVDSASGQRHISAHLKYSRDVRGGYAKLQAVIGKTPSSNANKPSLVCFDTTISSQETGGARTALTSSSSLHWGGNTCESDQHIALKLTSTGDVQTGSMKEYGSPNQCSRGSCHSSNERDDEKSSLKHTMQISYNRIAVELQNFTNEIYRMMKNRLYDEADVAQINVNNPKNKIVVEARDSTVHKNHYDITVKMPKENATFTNVALPFWILPDAFANPSEAYNKYTHKKHHGTHEATINEDRNEEYYGSGKSWYETPEGEEFENEFDDNESATHLPFDSEDQPDRKENMNRKTKHVENQHEGNQMKYEKPSLGLSEHAPWIGKRLEPKEKQEEDEEDDWLQPQKPSEQKPGVATEKLHNVHGRGKTCQVNGKTVKTLNNVNYAFPIPKCFTILSKDCTPQRRFIIMAKKIESGKVDSKELFVLTRTHKILVSVQSENPHVTVNDAPIKLAEQKQVLAPNSKTIHLLKTSSWINITLTDLGMRIAFDGSIIVIEFFGKVAAQQCGLCGQPSNQQNGKMWPDTTNSGYLKDLVSKYTILNENCDQSNKPPQSATENNPPLTDTRKTPADEGTHSMHHQDWSDKDSEQNHAEWYKPNTKSNGLIESHDMLEIGDKICISVDPVHTCSDDSYAASETKQRVSYFCVNRNDPKAAAIKQKVLAKQPIAATNGGQVHMVRLVAVATRCEKF